LHALFATPAYPPFLGGGERFAYSLARELAKNGIKITIVTSAATREQDFWRPLSNATEEVKASLEEGMQVYRCPTARMPGGFNGLLAWRKAMVVLSSLPGNQSSLLRKMAIRIPKIEKYTYTLESLPDNFDLVHSFNISWEFPSVAAWNFARNRSIPYLITPFIHTGVGYDDKVSRNATMDHQVGLYQNAQAVHTLTNLEKQRLQEYGLDPQKIETVGSGVDPTVDPDDDDVKWARELVSESFVLFIGRVSYDKGAITAAEAIRKLRNLGDKVLLVLVGQPTAEFDRYYRMITSDERSGIIHLGILSESKKRALLSRSDLLVLPSRTDSFGIVLLEAWSRLKPVIGAAAGGIPEVVSDGVDGFLVEFGDANNLATKIKLLLEDPDLRAQFAENGQQKIRDHYTWDRVGQKVMSSYEQILAD
jgi:glycogen(starch) synthase